MTPSSLLLTLALQGPLAPPPPLDTTARIHELGRQLEAIEDRFHEGLDDLANLDLVSLAWRFDDAALEIEARALRLDAQELTAEQRRQLERMVFDSLDYARYRVRDYEMSSAGVGQLAALLRNMRAANADGRPELAIALHTDRLGEVTIQETYPVLMRRLLIALADERQLALEELARPEALPEALPEARPR